MIRAVLLGLLAVSATSSCKSGSDSEKVAPGAVAGRVLQASGSVAATREGARRVLAAGNEVHGDDVIETGGDGAVVIELFHNHARWSVEANQRARVDGSVAWGLAKQDGPVKVVDHATSAAGRDGERSAADTRATTERPPAAQAPPADTGAVERDRQAEPKTAKPVRRGGISDDLEDPFATAPATKAVPPAVGRGAPRVTADIAPALPSRAPSDPVRVLVEAQRAALTGCLDAAAPHLTIVVRVVDGKAVFELTGGTASEPVRRCVDGIIKRIRFRPTVSGTVSI